MTHSPVYIIAEAGVNHNGDMDIALALIDKASEAGADAVKFQTFRAEELVTAMAAKAQYQQQSTDADESQLSMLRRLELHGDMHDTLIDHCRIRGIDFLSTPFDAASLDMLLDKGMGIIKIPSGEITNLFHLRAVGAKGMPVILSTGMATLSEVDDALACLQQAGTPRIRVTLLHCNTQYPTPFEDANLNAIKSLADSFPECTIGYSDHTEGTACPIAAVALGASVIEKHFTLDRAMTGPDHAASITPDELTAMVSSIRQIQQAMGDGIKTPSPSEQANILVARRYLVAARSIAAGEPLTSENVTAKRTGSGGLSPMKWDTVKGSCAVRSFAEGDRIEL